MFLSWRLPPRIVIPALLLWSLFVCWHFFQASPISWHHPAWRIDQWLMGGYWFHPYMGKVVLSLIVAAWLAWLAVHLGCMILSLFPFFKDMMGLERIVFGAGLGLGSLS
ncbi:MAG: hypothetical protein AB1515_10810, partial [Nitrospirota bacterium]